MFSGIIYERGKIVKLDTQKDDVLRLCCQAPDAVKDAKIGCSIAVNGVCLSVVDLHEDCFWVDVVAETLRKTNLGLLKIASEVNIERPLRYNERVEGHLVQGHVDGLAILESVHIEEDTSLWLTFKVPETLQVYLIEKGSITIDGVSLTIANVTEGSFSVALIPMTQKKTTLANKHPGDSVNIEIDLFTKFAQRMLLPLKS